MCGHDRDDQYQRDSRHFSREYSQGDMRSGMMGRMNTYDDDRKDMPQAMTKHTIPMMSGALMMQGSGMESIQGMMSDMSMANMGRMLEGLTGETLNQRFLEAMIPHHQAAVDMAKYIAASNKSELVKLGADIITSQTKEIEQMKAWQVAWGYTSTGMTTSGMMMSGMHMMPDGTMMQM